MRSVREMTDQEWNDAMEGWTDNQRCPVCKAEPDCDYCPQCETELVCAQSPEGFAEADLRRENGEPVLYLARIQDGE